MIEPQILTSCTIEAEPATGFSAIVKGIFVWVTKKIFEVIKIVAQTLAPWYLARILVTDLNTPPPVKNGINFNNSLWVFNHTYNEFFY